MEEKEDALSKLQKMASQFKDLSMLDIPTTPSIYNFVSQMPKVEIDKESTFAYQMQQQTNRIIEKSNEQIKLLVEHNERLESNYNKLEELYKLKENELIDLKKEAQKAKRMNVTMLIVAIISMLVAIAAWVTPLFTGGAA